MNWLMWTLAIALGVFLITVMLWSALLVIVSFVSGDKS